MALQATDFSCPICFDIFENPVVLSCSHSFCKDCLQAWWADKPMNNCPVCKRRSSKNDPPCNLVLKNLCETFTRGLSLQEKASAGSETLCSLHSEKLKLFCLDHEQPVCVICRDSKQHTNHRFRPIDEAAQEYREGLSKYLKTLQENLEHFNQVKVNWDQTAEHIKVQAQSAERRIRDEFKKIWYFLQNEETTRISVLRKEERLKSQMMKRKIEALSKNLADLSETIRATEKELKTDDVSLLQNYKAAVVRVQQCPRLDDPRLSSGALIDMAKHVGNLAFNIWNKMKDMISYSPVILDPNTAGPYLLMSDDLKSVRCVEGERQLPKNPERFEDYPTVLGSESFNSGPHSWDVEVNNDANWAVGVLAESVPRTGEIVTGYWEIWFQNGMYRAYAPPYQDKVLSLRNPLKRIRMNLDMNRRQLSYFDPDTKTDIHTFSQISTERLFPYINTLNTKPLKILPVRITLQSQM